MAERPWPQTAARGGNRVVAGGEEGEYAGSLDDIFGHCSRQIQEG